MAKKFNFVDLDKSKLPVTKGKKWILIVWVRENKFY